MDAIMAALVGLFAGLTFWWWIAILAWTVGLFPLVAYERGELALLALAAAGVALYFFAGFNVLLWIWVNPGTAVLFAITYFAVGALWSVPKWKWFADKRRENFNEKLQSFINDRLNEFQRGDWGNGRRGQEVDQAARSQVMTDLRAGRVPDALLEQWHQHVHQTTSRRGDFDANPPSPYQHKAKLTTWITFWPWSMFWWAFCDMIQKFVNWIWKRMVRIYTRISEYAFKDVDPRLLRRQ